MSAPVTIPALFDPAQTLTCGQAFRWREVLGEDSLPLWEGAAMGRILRLRKTPTEQGDMVSFFCSQEEFEAL